MAEPRSYDTAAGQTQIIHTGIYGFEYLVKNFSGEDIWVSMREGADKEESCRIPDGAAQVILINKDPTYGNGSGVLQVISDATSTGGIEVQCIKH